MTTTQLTQSALDSAAKLIAQAQCEIDAGDVKQGRECIFYAMKRIAEALIHTVQIA